MAKKKTADALTILDRMIGGDDELRQQIDQEYINAKIAQLIYEARTKARLTQQQLAERVGTQQPVIARLEDGDYRGHSLTMLHRIARALGRELIVQFSPPTRKHKTG
jgi:ribosome-binding protein aMBF1 (putative translation factor)